MRFLPGLSLVSALLFLTLAATPSAAEEYRLLVSGPGQGQSRTFSEADLRALPAVTFETFDPWDKKNRRYTGCNVLDLLQSAGVLDGVSFIEFVAKNDYRAKVAMPTAQEYAYILTYDMDGKDYSEYIEENKGPVAVAVKMETVSKSDALRVKDQLVWWLERINLK